MLQIITGEIQLVLMGKGREGVSGFSLRRERATHEWHLQLGSGSSMLELNGTRLSQCDLSRLRAFVQMIV